ncbi:alpha/beta fold hydrolase [Micromonospora trifolii]|uniref:alpha/beta fold hydrolase n=1 Tax=Micromonospora trifolii TaxID=2911208 RepID=UPI003D2EA731
MVGGRRLSYLDFGGSGTPLLALHGHYNEASAFTPLAEALTPQWRVIALDQRGHGASARAESYEREDYVADVAALHQHLKVGPAVVLGHSLGGVNAYQCASRHADRVTALIVEDIGAVVDCDWSFTTSLPRRAPSRDALASALGGRLPIWSAPSANRRTAGASRSRLMTRWRPRKRSTVTTGRIGQR